MGSGVGGLNKGRQSFVAASFQFFATIVSVDSGDV